MSGISFTGLGSGLPVSEIVSGLVEAESTPFYTRSNSEGSELTTLISADGALKSSMDAMLSSLKALQNEENYSLKSASEGDSFVSITADRDAQIGSYDIQVNNLAQAQKTMTKTFEDDDVVGEGILNFSRASDSKYGITTFSVEVGNEDTLEDLRNKINESSDNDSLMATIITESTGEQRLVMTSSETGVDNAITVSAQAIDGGILGISSRLNDLASSELTVLKPAKDASILIDGAVTLTSSTDVFSDALDGITLTANKAHDIIAGDNASEIVITENNDTIAAQLSGFIESYNAFQGLANQLGEAGGEEDTAGVLSGDSLLRSVTSKIRSMLSDSFKGTGGDNFSLAQIGVSTNDYFASSSETRDNFMFNRNEFEQALSGNAESIQAFFIGTEDSPGFAASLDGYITAYTEGNGLIDSRIAGYNDQITRLDKDVESFTLKMDAYEARLYAQYNSMDALVSSMNSTSTYLAGALASLPGVVSKS